MLLAVVRIRSHQGHPRSETNKEFFFKTEDVLFVVLFDNFLPQKTSNLRMLARSFRGTVIAEAFPIIVFAMIAPLGRYLVSPG